MDASSIGAEFSNYQGNAALGGADIGVINIDTKPLEQLASYTVMYNKSVWDQQQKETDAKVKELADLSKIHLNDLRGKDRDQATQEFADLQKYAAESLAKMPKTPQDKLKQELEWQTKLGAFNNNFSSGKERSISYLSHLNTIKNNITDPKRQDEAIKQLDRQFDTTGIETSISAMPKYKIENIDIPAPTPQKINVIGIDGNDNYDVEATVWNPALNTANADATVFGIKKNYPEKGSQEYLSLSQNEKDAADQQATVDSNGKIWTDMTDPLNQAIKKPEYYDADGNFLSQKFEDDNASNSVVMKAYSALKNMDQYSKGKFNEASNGMFSDKGISFKLPSNLNPNDFKSGFVDFKKGITPSQLVQAGMFAKYTGDNFQKKVTHTGDQKAFDLEKMRELNAIKLKNKDEEGANFRAGLDLIGKGYIRDAKGKWNKPAAAAATTATNGGVVPYWQNYIAPQLSTDGIKPKVTESSFVGKSVDWVKGKFGVKTADVPAESIPKDYTGDIEVETDKISGLSTVLFGEVDDAGHQLPVTDKTDVKVRYEKGIPSGVVIDGVFYDANDINTKATMRQDKSLSNKADTPIYNPSGGGQAAPGGTAPAAIVTTPAPEMAMTEEEFQNFLKKKKFK